ncbi:sex-determining region Y protein-like [Limulus polyphemus]|uniref:Sex-determining region Y protein-like n=1 Tax=Limulus polyphemus TaxID=6850 RepID=A0ABM1SRQ4_LIMPO|nr:sex-determining region Y protein-like [Limulus polyphemus]
MNTIPLCYILFLLARITTAVDYSAMWESMNSNDILYSPEKSSDEHSHNEMGEYDMDYNSEINEHHNWDNDQNHHYDVSQDHHSGHDVHSKGENSSNEPMRSEMDKHDTHDSKYIFGITYDKREPKTGNSDEKNHKRDHDQDHHNDFSQDYHHEHEAHGNEDHDGHKVHEHHQEQENEHVMGNEAGSYHKTILYITVAFIWSVVLMN